MTLESVYEDAKSSFCISCLQFECAHHFESERQLLNRKPKNQIIELSDDVGFLTEKELERNRKKNKALDRMLFYKEMKAKELKWL